MYDIIIIGAGPAGLTAGIYACRANKKVLILEARSYGGQIIKANEIDNYPSKPHINGMQFAKDLYDQTIELGANILFEKAIDIKDSKDYKTIITNKNSYKGKTIIIATGSDNGKLGLENEKELTGRGISYCATCDGSFYRDEDVAIIGNSNNTLEDTIYLSNIANKVYLINKKDTFEDLNGLLKELSDNVEILYNTNITKIIGDKKLEQIEVKTKDESRLLNISGLFIDVGRVPENENFKKLIKVDKFGYIIASEDCHTNIDGIFVAGDNRTKIVRQLTTATADGTVAAIEAIKYINSMKEE